MAFETLATLDFDGEATPLGGINKQTGKPNPKSIEGYYIGFKVTDSKYGPSKLHVFQTKDGNKGVWGKSNLDNQLTLVAFGTMVRATFVGTVPSNKGNDMLKYKVEVDKENTIDVGSPINDIPTECSDQMEEETSLSDTSDYEESAPTEYTPAPRKPSTPAKPNPSKTQALLSGRKTV